MKGEITIRAFVAIIIQSLKSHKHRCANACAMKGGFPAKKRGQAFRYYLFARDLSKRITAAILNAAPVNLHTSRY